MWTAWGCPAEGPLVPQESEIGHDEKQWRPRSLDAIHRQVLAPKSVDDDMTLGGKISVAERTHVFARVFSCASLRGAGTRRLDRFLASASALTFIVLNRRSRTVCGTRLPLFVCVCSPTPLHVLAQATLSKVTRGCKKVCSSMIRS